MVALATDREVKWILSDAPFMFARYSRDLRYQYVSRAYAAMIGREPDEIVGKPMIDIMGPDRFEKIRPQVEAVLQGQQAEFEVEMNFSGGSRRLHAIYGPEQDERGLVVGWFCSILNISEVKQVEHDKNQVEQLLSELRLPQARVGIWHRNFAPTACAGHPNLKRSTDSKPAVRKAMPTFAPEFTLRTSTTSKCAGTQPSEPASSLSLSTGSIAQIDRYGG